MTPTWFGTRKPLLQHAGGGWAGNKIPRVSLETQGFCFLNQKNVCVSVAPTETIPTNQTTKTNHLTIAIGITIIANQVILFHSEIERNFMRRN